MALSPYSTPGSRPFGKITNGGKDSGKQADDPAYGKIYMPNAKQSQSKAGIAARAMAEKSADAKAQKVKNKYLSDASISQKKYRDSAIKKP